MEKVTQFFKEEVTTTRRTWENLTEEEKETIFNEWEEKNYTNYEIINTGDEIITSFETFLKLLIGDKGFFKINTFDTNLWADLSECEIVEFSGRRLFSLYENRIAGPFRYGWDSESKRKAKKFGYKPGEMYEFPFTGTVYDSIIIDVFVREMKNGENLGNAVENVAEELSREFHLIVAYLKSEEYFIENEVPTMEASGEFDLVEIRRELLQGV